MTKTNTILSAAVGLEPEFIEFANEANIIRPVEAEEAMQTACVEFAEWMRKEGWRACMESDSSWMKWYPAGYKPQHGEWIIMTTSELFKIWNENKNTK